jgi:hypothetical protein
VSNISKPCAHVEVDALISETAEGTTGGALGPLASSERCEHGGRRIRHLRLGIATNAASAVTTPAGAEVLRQRMFPVVKEEEVMVGVCPGAVPPRHALHAKAAQSAERWLQ